jgi:hypothetical protein
MGACGGHTVRGTPAAPQVISGNGSAGLSLSGAQCRNHLIIGNFIGADVTGTQRLPNGISGITLDGTFGVVIGGTNTGERNVISGNQESGIYVFNGATSNTVMGNLIGLGSNGVTALSNRFDGIRLYHSPSNILGGTGRGNYIGGNQGSGILLEGTGSVGNLVQGNTVGMGPSSNAAPNGNVGIYVWEARGNSIGGTGSGQGNTVVHGLTDAIFIRGSHAMGNLLARNLVGLDAAGVRRRNAGNGVRIDGGISNQVGAVLGLGGNVLSGNGGAGIYFAGNAQGNRIYGNLVGLDGTGQLAVSNESYGIRVEDAPGTAIGLSIGPNAISGNAGAGIRVLGASSNVVIQGNYIGLSGAGTNAVPNDGDGIFCTAPGLSLGGTGAGEGNIISGNSVNGLVLGAGADDALVLGNYVGLDRLGRIAVSNRQYGILVQDARRVRIGNGTSAGRNVIACSRLSDIEVQGNASNAVIAGNFVGTGWQGTNAVGTSSGIEIFSSHVTLGGTNAGDRNIICGSDVAGVYVGSGRVVRIQGNYIGVGSNGVQEVQNYYGVRIGGQAEGVLVGGAESGARNVIARNIGNEVFLEGPAGGHVIQGNYIGLDAGGAPYAGLSGGSLVWIQNSASNLVGGTASAGGNAMGCAHEGVMIIGTGSFANVVSGNLIGTDATGTDPARIFYAGVELVDASSNRIGGTAAGELNVIAHSGVGIVVTNSPGANAVGNLLAPNLVYSNSPGLGIDLGGEGLTANDAGDADAGANGRQNRPVLTNAFIAGPLVYAQGVLTSAPARTYLVDLFRADGTNAASRIYLGRVPVTTDGAGVGAFSAGFPILLAAGTYLSATATDPGRNTSEFAASPFGLVVGPGDSDGDLIPDFWESLYGLNPAVSNAAGSDADLDGFSDLDEYVADTAANSDMASPLITAISNKVAREITFRSSGARVYRLEANADLVTNPVWSLVSGPVTGFHGFTTLPDAGSLTTRAYRVTVSLP